MADWTTIPNSSLEPGSPARSIDALALRDNPIAITEGATGAPRVSDAGLSTTVTSTGQAWVSNRLTTNAVLAQIAGLTAGAVGSMCISATYNAIGTTTAGSNLRRITSYTGGTGFGGDWITASQGFTGTWRALGSASSYNEADRGAQQITLYVRIA